MFNTFIDKALNLVDRSFLFGWWIPAFVTGSILILLINFIDGSNLSVELWPQNITTQGETIILTENLQVSHTILGQFIKFTLIVTFFAIILYLFYFQLIRFYEGYWPLWVRSTYVDKMWLNISRKSTKQKFEFLVKEKDKHAQDSAVFGILEQRLFYEYPSDEDLLLPTKLGNVIRAAEIYSQTRYGMDGVFWWPRLWHILPDYFRKELDNALLSVIALLNFTTLFLFGYLIIWFLQPDKIWKPIILLLLIIFLSYVTYLGAVSQAVNYGILIRSAVDLYRFDLLDAMHLPLPENSEKEKQLWQDLSKYSYRQRGKIDYVHYGSDDDLPHTKTLTITNFPPCRRQKRHRRSP